MKMRLSKFVILTIYILMTLMLALRYGQGTDYFSYKALFEVFSNVNNVIRLQKEPFYKALSYIVSLIGDFRILIGLIALVNMLMIWRFFKIYSPNKMISMMLLFPVLYLIYFGSLLRQGLCIVAFLAWGLRLIERREWGKYFFLCIILSMIHIVSLIYLTIPFIIKFSVNSLTLCILLFIPLGWVILYIGGAGIPYAGKTSSS